MGHQSIGLSADLQAYLLDHGVRETPSLKALRDVTASHPDLSECRARNQIAPEQGQYMAWLVRLMQAQKYLEWGTFTGYSTAVVAMALPDHGCVYACDIDAAMTVVAQQHWAQMGVADRIHHQVCTLEQHAQDLLRQGHAGTFDLIFIDASKKSSEKHYEWALQLCRPGGVILVDDVLQGGRVVTPHHNDWCAQAMHAFNRARHRDIRVDVSLLPVGDGLMQMIKR